MNYTDIINWSEEDNTIVNWRRRRGKTQLLCPRCDRFFDIPEDIKIDDNGYASAVVYHFCEDLFDDEENNEGWVVLPHLVEWGKL